MNFLQHVKQFSLVQIRLSSMKFPSLPCRRRILRKKEKSYSRGRLDSIEDNSNKLISLEHTSISPRIGPPIDTRQILDQDAILIERTSLEDSYPREQADQYTDGYNRAAIDCLYTYKERRKRSRSVSSYSNQHRIEYTISTKTEEKKKKRNGTKQHCCSCLVFDRHSAVHTHVFDYANVIEQMLVVVERREEKRREKKKELCYQANHHSIVRLLFQRKSSASVLELIYSRTRSIFLKSKSMHPDESVRV